MKEGLYRWILTGLFVVASFLFIVSDRLGGTDSRINNDFENNEIIIEYHEINTGVNSSHSDTQSSLDPEESTVKDPLKIFIMVGQSNTEGHGYINKKKKGRFLNGTLEWLVETDPDTYGKLKTYDESGDSVWTERSDVMIAYNDQDYLKVRPEINVYGPLAAGYGYKHNEEMGPELGFGWTVGDALGESSSSEAPSEPNIMLLKVAWGGRSLAVEYRPPSSEGTTGLYYEAMLTDIYAALTKLSNLVPGYTHDRGYEIAGFAWHQGWNDGCDDDMTAEYESNLANLIRDIRIDLNIPDLPVSIGVSGMCGWDPYNVTVKEGDKPKTLEWKKRQANRRNAIVEAQLAVADPDKYPEFAGTVASAETRDFYRDVSVSPGNQIYHWNNNCESYWLVGQAMGENMIKLLRNKEAALNGQQIESNVSDEAKKEKTTNDYDHSSVGEQTQSDSKDEGNKENHEGTKEENHSDSKEKATQETTTEDKHENQTQHDEEKHSESNHESKDDNNRKRILSMLRGKQEYL